MCTYIKMEYLKENQIKKPEMIIKASKESNEKENSNVNNVTEIKRENISFNSTFIDTEHNHVQFENVLIKMEREDQFFEENEKFENKPQVNQDEVISFVTWNDAQLTACAIKNDDMGIKVEENYDYSLCSEKCTNNLSTNLDEIKIDIVNNDIESVNCETYIQYKSENIEEFSKEHATPMENEYKTKKDASSWLTAIKEESTSKSSKLQDIDNQKVIPAKIQQYECNVCKKQYIGSTSLRKHMRIHTEEKLHASDVCKKKFSCLPDLKKHTIIHTGEELHECDVCQQKFNQLSNLMGHKRIHTGEKPYICDVCQKKFTLSSGLICHKRIHTGERPYECDVCQKKFTQLSSLQCHKRTHTGEKPHTCDVCHKKFNQLFNLVSHKKTHTGEKPRTCNICQKKFSHTSSMMHHKRIHTSEKPHTCDVCQKKFTQLYNLIRHKGIHTGEKSHECDVCQKKFNQLSYLKKHMKIHMRKSISEASQENHNGEKPH